MIPKTKDRAKAIALRKKGKSYREIVREVKVAKSTLSLWLRDVELSKKQNQRLSRKKLEAGRRGGIAQTNKRIRITKEIKEQAKEEISKIVIDAKTLWLMGIMLYWAEGAKAKETSPSTGVKFGNSDPQMVKLFVKWLIEICKIPANDIKYELYIHENSANRLDKVKAYWARNLDSNIGNFQTVYFKKNIIRTNRKKIGENYFGLLNVVVRKSTYLNRKISGWIEGINASYWEIV